MNLTPYVENLRQELLLTVESEDERTRAVADRLTARLESVGRLVLLEALSDAVGEISLELAPGSVEVRLRGREPEFVVDVAVGDQFGGGEALASYSGETEEGSSQRTTLRLPDQLKSRVDELAAREGVSVNTWLVRAVANAMEQTGRDRSAAARNTSGGQRFVGWAE